MKIIKSNSEENAKLLLVGEIFETLNMSDTYAEYGMQISAEDAGDSIEVLKDVNNFVWDGSYKTTLAKDDIITAFSDPELYRYLNNKYKGTDNEYFQFHKETVLGYTYHNGQIWKTITVDQPNGEPSHQIMEGELFDQIIAEYENAKQIDEGFGLKILQSKNFVYTESNFTGDFELATVETIEEYQYRLQQNSEHENKSQIEEMRLQLERDLEIEEQEQEDYKNRNEWAEEEDKERMKLIEEEELKRMEEAD